MGERHYYGTRAPHARVLVLDDGNERPLRHVVRHSPTGLEWGYGGSGPADLALSILVDALGDEGWCRSCNGSGIEGAGDGRTTCVDCMGGRVNARVQAAYMTFKFNVVAAWPRTPMSSWKTTRTDVLAWLARFERGEVKRG